MFEAPSMSMPFAAAWMVQNGAAAVPLPVSVQLLLV
jgi:hypothetical protein